MNHSSLDVLFIGQKYDVTTLGDDWCTLAPIRLVQHLANVWHLLEPTAFTKDSPTTHRLNNANVFGPNLTDHLWTLWAAQSHLQYGWLYFYALDIADEYERRMGEKSKGHRHGIRSMLAALDYCPEATPEGGWDEPTFAKGVE